MMNFEMIGKGLILFGLALTAFGGLVLLLSRAGMTQLPGTLRINFPGGQCVFPILASIVASVVLTVLLNLIARWLNR